MKNSFFCKSPYINLYYRPSLNSKISSQILYGEKFKILLKKKNFLKIKNSYDNYVGYIKSSNYENKFKLTSFSFGIGIKKGNIDLLQYFNAVIHVMKNIKKVTR